MDKKETYIELLKKAKGLLEDEPNAIANLANISALLKEDMGFFWVGFYLVKGEELVLGPFQGPVACTRIAKGNGVCGTAWIQEKTQIVDDVHAFPGHIACNPNSKSEIVVPVFSNDKVVMVLDVDSDELAQFDSLDRDYLEKLSNVLGDASESWIWN